MRPHLPLNNKGGHGINFYHQKNTLIPLKTVKENILTILSFLGSNLADMLSKREDSLTNSDSIPSI